jgi:hypothetical protein
LQPQISPSVLLSLQAVTAIAPPIVAAADFRSVSPIGKRSKSAARPDPDLFLETFAINHP